jgi:flagellar basal-body rod protein FlgB
MMGLSNFVQNGLMDRTVKVLSRALDYRSTNQQVISENLANIDTPGYKFKRVRFDQELQSAHSRSSTGLKTTNSGHYSEPVNFKSETFPIEETGEKNVGSNQLNIDKEMAKMMSNNLLYEATTRLISKKLRNLKSVIEGTRR